MIDLTPAELANIVSQHEATILVLRMVVAELVADLPDERRNAILNGLSIHKTNARNLLSEPGSLARETTLEHIPDKVDEMTLYVERRPLANAKDQSQS